MAASWLWASVTAWMSPVRCRLSASIGTTWLWPPPAAPPLMPNTGPIEAWRTATVAVLPMCLKACPRPTVVVVFPSPRGVGVMAETTTYLALGMSASSSIASSFILATPSPYGSRRCSPMPICAAISPSGSSFACRATCRFFGNVMLSLGSLVFGGSEPVDLDAELVSGVQQGVEEVLARGPLAMQQVRSLAVQVVTYDVGDELRDRTAEGRPVGCHFLGEVDAAHLRQQVRRPRAGNPYERPPVRYVEDAYQSLIRHPFHAPCDLLTRSWRGEQQPLARARADDEHSGFVAGGAPEADAERKGCLALHGREHEHLGERGAVHDPQAGAGAQGADLPTVLHS